MSKPCYKRTTLLFLLTIANGYSANIFWNFRKVMKLFSMEPFIFLPSHFDWCYLVTYNLKRILCICEWVLAVSKFDPIAGSSLPRKHLKRKYLNSHFTRSKTTNKFYSFTLVTRNRLKTDFFIYWYTNKKVVMFAHENVQHLALL